MLTQAELKEQLRYDPETGDFIRLRANNSTVRVGDIAGGIHTSTKGKKYRVISVCGKMHSAHRLAHLYMNGKFPDNQVDHDDGNGLHNKWSNIKRDVTRRENGRNSRMRSNNTSGFCGVAWHKPSSRWMGHIEIDGKAKYLGAFIEKEDAIAARQAANVLYGFHINHGQARPL